MLISSIEMVFSIRVDQMVDFPQTVEIMRKTEQI